MRGYMIFDLEIVDPAAWEEYRAVAGPLMAAAGGAFMLRAQVIETLEGDWNPASLSVVEFPDYDKALAFYRSPAYQATIPLRRRAARGRGILIGADPPPKAQA